MSHSPMQDSKLDRLANLEIVGAGVAPAAALGFACREAGGWRISVGCAGRTPSGPVGPQTVFDLASLTKPFVAAAFARLRIRGDLQKATPLGSLLEESRGTSTESTTLELLLSHRGGLPAHQAFFEPLVHGRPFVRSAALHQAASARPKVGGAPPEAGHRALYSDLGYLLAGVALERKTRISLDALVRAEVAQPLGLAAGSARQLLNASIGFCERVAPTESVPFRGGLLSGVVHDDNAWAFGGHSLCGHAGLFGTVEDLLKFGMGLLDGLSGRSRAWLMPGPVRDLVRERPGGTLRMGFDGKSGPLSSAGPSASELSFGHLGFTGTSFWCDPVADVVGVLLSNRVCPTRENVAIRSARPQVHEALFLAARPGSPR